MTLQRVPRELRNVEADLFTTKWFDYRTWHPAHATYYWAHCYIEATKDFCRQMHDSERADSLKVFNTEDIFASRDLNAVTRARQSLDSIGVRYEYAMSWYIERFSNRGWIAMPRPNQLYSEETVLDLRDSWDAWCASSFQVPRGKAFRTESYVGKKFRETVRKELRLRRAEAWRLCSRLIAEKIVTPEWVQAEVGPDVCARALAVLNSTGK